MDSDIAVGISDGATVLFFINNDRGDSGSSVFAANTTINNDLPSYVDANQGAFPIPGAGRNEFSVVFDLTRDSAEILIKDLSGVFQDQAVSFSEQFLADSSNYSLVVHGDDISDIYFVRTISILFSEE